MKDYYRILGINNGASKDEIRTAYRKLSKKFHPDVNQGDKFFEQRFKEIEEAYNVLMNNFNDKIVDKNNVAEISKTNISRKSERKTSIKSLIAILCLIGVILTLILLYLTNKKTDKQRIYYMPDVLKFENQFPNDYSLHKDYRQYYQINLDSDITKELILPLSYNGSNWLEGKSIKLLILDFRNDWEVTETFECKNEIIKSISLYPTKSPSELHMTTQSAGLNYTLLNLEIIKTIDFNLKNIFPEKYSENTDFKLNDKKWYGISHIRENGVSSFGCQKYTVRKYELENGIYNLTAEKVTNNRFGRDPLDSKSCELYSLDKVLTDIIFNN